MSKAILLLASTISLSKLYDASDEWWLFLCLSLVVSQCSFNQAVFLPSSKHFKQTQGIRFLGFWAGSFARLGSFFENIFFHCALAHACLCEESSGKITSHKNLLYFWHSKWNTLSARILNFTLYKALGEHIMLLVKPFLSLFKFKDQKYLKYSTLKWWKFIIMAYLWTYCPLQRKRHLYCQMPHLLKVSVRGETILPNMTRLPKFLPKTLLKGRDDFSQTLFEQG